MEDLREKTNTESPSEYISYLLKYNEDYKAETDATINDLKRKLAEVESEKAQLESKIAKIEKDRAESELSKTAIDLRAIVDKMNAALESQRKVNNSSIIEVENKIKRDMAEIKEAIESVNGRTINERVVSTLADINRKIESFQSIQEKFDRLDKAVNEPLVRRDHMSQDIREYNELKEEIADIKEAVENSKNEIVQGINQIASELDNKQVEEVPVEKEDITPVNVMNDNFDQEVDKEYEESVQNSVENTPFEPQFSGFNTFDNSPVVEPIAPTTPVEEPAIVSPNIPEMSAYDALVGTNPFEAINSEEAKEKEKEQEANNETFAPSSDLLASIQPNTVDTDTIEHEDQQIIEEVNTTAPESLANGIEPTGVLAEEAPAVSETQAPEIASETPAVEAPAEQTPAVESIEQAPATEAPVEEGVDKVVASEEAPQEMIDQAKEANQDLTGNGVKVRRSYISIAKKPDYSTVVPKSSHVRNYPKEVFDAFDKFVQDVKEKIRAK